MPPHSSSQELLKSFAEDTRSGVLQALELLKTAQEYLTGAGVNLENCLEVYRDIHPGEAPGNDTLKLKIVLSDANKNLEAVINALDELQPPALPHELQPVTQEQLEDFINKS